METSALTDAPKFRLPMGTFSSPPPNFPEFYGFSPSPPPQKFHVIARRRSRRGNPPKSPPHPSAPSQRGLAPPQGGDWGSVRTILLHSLRPFGAPPSKREARRCGNPLRIPPAYKNSTSLRGAAIKAATWQSPKVTAAPQYVIMSDPKGSRRIRIPNKKRTDSSAVKSWKSENPLRSATRSE